MSIQTKIIKNKKNLFWLWVPLALSWLVMSIQCPILQSFIGKSNNQIVNLAVFGLLFSISMFFEGIVIPFFPATVALVKNKNDFLRLRYYTLCVSCAVSLLFSGIFISDNLFELIFVKALNLDTTTTNIIRQSSIIFLSPLLVGYRRFYQGLLVIQNKNSYITCGTIIRIIAIVASFLTFSHSAPSGTIGIVALITGYASEAIFIRLSYHYNKLVYQTTTTSLSYRDIFRFHYPLALNTAVDISSQPLILLLISKGSNALVALALYPVLANFVFLCGCPTKAMLELIINVFCKSDQNTQEVKKFHCLITAAIFALMILVPYKFVFGHLYGLNDTSISNVAIVYYLLPFLPLLGSIIVWKKAFFMTIKKTLIITAASYLELIVTLVSLSLLIHSLQPLLAAFIARLFARLCAVVLLLSKNTTITN